MKKQICVFLTLLTSVFLALPVFGAADGSILGWGIQVVDSAELAQKNHIAISTGGSHSLTLKKQVCLYVLGGDLNDDCKVDFYDFASMAANWLIDCDISPDNPACVPK